MLRRGYSDLDYTGLPQMDFQKKRYSMAILEINLFQPLKKTAYIKKICLLNLIHIAHLSSTDLLFLT